jgi:hypothetical protein
MDKENLKIVDEYVEGERLVFFVERIDSKKSWPPNSMIVFFVCHERKYDLQKAMKSYKILNIGTDDTKIVSILDLSKIIYKSK